jgi:NADH dehydrogenase
MAVDRNVMKNNSNSSSGVPSESDKETQSPGPRSGPAKILILGSGFGGAYALRRMLDLLKPADNLDISLVSSENFFLFTPFLHMVAMGSIDTRHIAYPIRRLQSRDRFKFVQAEVLGIDLKKREVQTSAGSKNYDYLLLALGSVTRMPDFPLIPGSSGCFTLKTMNDSVLIRNHIISRFEQASAADDPQKIRELLTFVVAGAGYTGIQLITELRDFIHRSLLRFYRSVKPADVCILLVETEPKIMAGSKEKISAHVERCLRDMGVEVKLNSRITRIEGSTVEINGGEIVRAGTVLWVAGVVSNPLIANMAAQVDEIGRIPVDDFLEVPGYPGVYAVGDCSRFVDRASGFAIPPRAHTTVRQAKKAAYNILAEVRGKPRKPYQFSNPFDTVSLGSTRAVFRYHGFYLFGIPARLIWLAGYITLSTGYYTRARILTDWLLSAIFGRDITNLTLGR